MKLKCDIGFRLALLWSVWILLEFRNSFWCCPLQVSAIMAARHCDLMASAVFKCAILAFSVVITPAFALDQDFLASDQCENTIKPHSVSAAKFARSSPLPAPPYLLAFALAFLCFVGDVLGQRAARVGLFGWCSVIDCVVFCRVWSFKEIHGSSLLRLLFHFVA